MIKIYQRLSRSLCARNNCLLIDDDAAEKWSAVHQNTIDSILDTAPHGSGFDAGTQLSESSTPEKLIFTTAYHHMRNDMYDGWTEHLVTVTPSLQCGFKLKVSGKNRNAIKTYIDETFYSWLEGSCEAD